MNPNPSNTTPAKRPLLRLALLLFRIGFVALTIFYLLACLAPYISPVHGWPLAAAGLLFPFLYLAMSLSALVLSLFRSPWKWAALFLLLPGIPQARLLFGWHKANFQPAKAPNTLRVLTWNVSSWDENNKVQRGGTSYRNKMLASIDSSQADVLCLQEFFEGKNPKYFEPTIPVLEKMGYWYHYYVHSCMWPDSTSLGIGIFSKYPIQGANQYSFGPNAYAQQLVQTDVVFHNQVVRFFTVHLQSFHLGSQDYAQLHTIKKASITHVEGSINILQKFKYAARQRALQADMVRQHINQSPYPVIVTGDFNDVPNSYTYHRIRSNLRDVFVDRGNGLGRTFHYLSPTLRIDYILTHPSFRTTQYQLFRYPYSEHNGVLADVQITP